MLQQKGLLLLRVKRFEGTRDGRKAYRYLYEYCEGQGSEDTKATRALEDLMALELTKGGNYGMDAFLNKFESILQILDECRELPSDRFQKILLLSHVRDDSYKSVKTLLKLNTEKKFDDCVLELQKCGIDMAHNGSRNAKARANLGTTEEKLNNNNINRKMQGNRKSNNSSTSNTQADEKDEYYMNPEIYKRLSR